MRPADEGRARAVDELLTFSRAFTTRPQSASSQKEADTLDHPAKSTKIWRMTGGHDSPSVEAMRVSRSVSKAQPSRSIIVISVSATSAVSAERRSMVR
eukprot:3492090-Rhodomonas_salina.1